MNRSLEIKNLIDSYTKRQLNAKSQKQTSFIKLPKLARSYSYHMLIRRKIEKLRALNSRNKNNIGEKKLKSNLSSLFCIHHINYISQRINYYDKPTTNYINNCSHNSVTYNSNSKTNSTINGNGNIINKNNMIKIIKIKQNKNNKNTFDEHKSKKESGLFKKKYFIKKKNRDIFDLINSSNNYIFFPKISFNKKNDAINSFHNNECEKNGN